MTIFLRGACALLLTGAFAGGAMAQTGDQKAVAAMFQDVAQQGVVEQVSCDCGAVDCGDCGSDCGDACGSACDLGCGSGGCGIGAGQFFVGGEWLNMRSTFSEATAYRVINQDDTTFNPDGEITETLEQFDFNYGSSFRVYGGYRLCNCASELRFTYTNFDTDGDFNSGALDTNDGSVSLDGPYEVVVPGDGDSISGTADTDVDTYDIAFAKTIPLGSPLGCCDPCGCDPCCKPCPAWDIQFIGGIRVASVDSRLSYASLTPSTTIVPDRVADSVVSFDGVGLRGGVLGRRYIGRNGVASLYVRGDISLLLGDVDYYATGTAFPRTSISTTEVIPVTDLEAGGTVYLTSNLSVSAGYLLSAWHDLGHRAEYDFSVTGTQLQSMDDANMMMFDGFFLRAEAAF